jgi:hypothetical protein
MHEERFNILSHKGNANHDIIEIPSHLARIPSPRIETAANVGEDVGKKGLVNCWWECKLV